MIAPVSDTDLTWNPNICSYTEPLDTKNTTIEVIWDSNHTDQKTKANLKKVAGNELHLVHMTKNSNIGCRQTYILGNVIYKMVDILFHPECDE